MIATSVRPTSAKLPSVRSMTVRLSSSPSPPPSSYSRQSWPSAYCRAAEPSPLSCDPPIPQKISWKEHSHDYHHRRPVRLAAALPPRRPCPSRRTADDKQRFRRLADRCVPRRDRRRRTRGPLGDAPGGRGSGGLPERWHP